MVERTSRLLRPRLPFPFLAAWAVLTAACSDGDPAGPGPNPLEITILSGDGQTALAGEELPRPLEVRVQERSSGSPVSEAIVEWTAVSGTGVTLAPARGTTDAQGVARTTVTLGPELGTYRIDATLEGREAVPASFTASAILPPELASVTPSEAAPGSTVVLQGQHFSPVARDNVVLFSGVRGTVTSASPTELRVTVPSCLPERRVEVMNRIGSLETRSRELAVVDGGVDLDLGVGEAIELVDDDGLDCRRLPGGGREYLAVVSAASQVAAAQWPYTLTGLTSGGTVAAAAPIRQRLVARRRAEPQSEWDRHVRALEADLAPDRVDVSPRSAARAIRVPQVGERRDFRVLNRDNGFTTVTAEVVHVSERAAVYVDLEAPGGGLGPFDFSLLAGEFDDQIFPTVTETFGRSSDLDGNQRIVILFTPVVNQLTERDADGFVGGFFFGLDLLPERENSNGGEVFYAIVPDPDGDFGDPRSRELILDVVPAILAHEFQHMVHFNERVLERGAQTQEALWLSEALAQAAEDVVGERFAETGNPERAVAYQSGNWIRAERYLRDPADVSLIVTQGVGTLAERGGGWLFVRYLQDQFGSDDILGQLTRTTRTGVANVTAVTGRSWEDQFPEWSAAIYLDGAGVPVDAALTYPELDLRAVIDEVTSPFPLEPERLGLADFTAAGELWSSASAHVLIAPPPTGSVAVVLAGAEQGPVAPAARQRLRLVRMR